MRYVTDIDIVQMIVHILNPLCPGGPILSQREISLSSNPKLKDYFITHISNVLQDSAAKAARFTSVNGGTVAEICEKLLNKSLGFVEGSNILGRKLYEIMGKDKRISPGDLIVCLYKANKQSYESNYLALLKIDPSDVFRHRTYNDDQGNTCIDFEIEKDVMPTTREKIQKSACIQALETRDYDMMLLDRQVKSTAKEVATFFTQNFLEAEMAFDSRKRTDALYKSLISARNSLRPELDLATEELLTRHINDIITYTHINIDSWLDSLPLSDEHKKEINNIIVSAIPDREFEIDTSFIKKLVAKRRVKGDYGLRVEIDANNFSQVIKMLEPSDKSVSEYYEIVLRTKKWDEISK